jgi:serine/threonine-protein kinase
MLKRDAAIKVIRGDVLNSGGGDVDALLRRFEREARATSALKSPHTVQIHDFGITEDGVFYYVMELLDGLSLDALVERYGPQPAGRVAHILSQACDSLAEAHRNQLIHRDIKPANILLCRYGLKWDFVKLLDFGLVKSTLSLGTDEVDLTAAAMVGTPAFVPPEVAQSESPLDARSDIYSLGCVGYWLLSGSLVFEAATPLKMVLDHIQTEPQPPSSRTEVPIPEDLERLIMSCLNKDPVDRPQSAEDLSQLLAKCTLFEPWSETRAAGWWKVHSPATHVSSAQITEPGDEHRLSFSHTTRRARLGNVNKWFLVALAVLGLVGFGWGLWLAVGG